MRLQVLHSRQIKQKQQQQKKPNQSYVYIVHMYIIIILLKFDHVEAAELVLRLSSASRIFPWQVTHISTTWESVSCCADVSDVPKEDETADGCDPSSDVCGAVYASLSDSKHCVKPGRHRLQYYHQRFPRQLECGVRKGNTSQNATGQERPPNMT